jgi:hypothetical protein
LAVVYLLIGAFLTAGCSQTTQKTPHKRETGRRAGTGIPTKMLSKVMAYEGENGAQQNQGVCVFEAPYEKVYKAVRKLFTEKEYSIRRRSLKKGIIETGYRLHDGDFSVGFLGKLTRSKMVANLKKLEPQKTEVTLQIMVEEEVEKGTWQHFPVSDFDMDLIDGDSFEIYFHHILKILKPHVASGS